MGIIRRCIASVLAAAMIAGSAVIVRTPVKADTVIAKEISFYSAASDSPVQVPDTYEQEHQITLADLGLTSGTITNYSIGQYSVTVPGESFGGSSVKVTTDGLLTPGCWYWKGGMGSSSPVDGYTRTTPYVGYTVIRVTVKDNNKTSYYYILAHNYNYLEKYGDDMIDKFIAENITPDMSIKEIVTAATRWTAEKYSYGNNQSYYNMIAYGYGDCWASADLINTICQRCGLHSWIRNANRDSGAGSGHKNAIIEDPENGVWYIGEAGYGGDAPRYYNVDTRRSLFCYRIKTYSNDNPTCEVYQLDGDTDTYQSTTVIEVPSKLDKYKVVSVGDKFIMSNTVVQRVILPDTVTSIGVASFHSCSSLTDLNIPAGVTSIGNSAFHSCTKIKRIVLPDAVTSIGDSAFLGCSSLASMSIPSGVSAIGASTFQRCVSLGSISIPSSVTSIGKNAFSGCTSLTDVYFGGTEEEWNTIEIGDGNGVLDGVRVHFNSTVDVYSDLPSDVAVVVSKSLDLNGKIGVNFKLKLPQEILSDRSAYIDINGTHYSVPSPDGQGNYVFTYYCAAAEIRDELVLTVHKGNGSICPLYTSAWQDVTATGFVYSVDAYIQRVSPDTTIQQNLRNLVNTLSDYGKQAQIFFDYNADAGSFSNQAGYAASISYSNLSKFKPVITSDSEAGIARKSSQLELISATTLIHNFTLSSGSISDYVITVDGKVITTSTKGDITLKEEGGVYRLRIANIAAAELQIPHKVEVKDLSGKTVINISNYSALSYAYVVLEAADPYVPHGLNPVQVDADLVKLMRMLYKYNRAAMEYWGITDVAPVYDAEPEEVVVPDSVDEPEAVDESELVADQEVPEITEPVETPEMTEPTETSEIPEPSGDLGTDVATEPGEPQEINPEEETLPSEEPDAA